MSKDNKEMPPGWVEASIGDVTIPKVPQKLPSPESYFTYIDISSIDNELKKITSPKKLFGKEAPSRARKVICAGDVLVSMTRPNLNAVAIVPDELDNSIASTGFDVLRTIQVEPLWLFHNVCFQDFICEMTKLVQGALYPAIKSRDIRGYNILIPPLNEQKRIVAKIEKLQAHSQHAMDVLESIPDLIEQFRQSVLSVACSGDLTSDWRERNPHVEPVKSFLKKIQKERKYRYEMEVEKANLEGIKKPKKNYEIKIYEDDELVRGWAKAKLENLIYIAGRIGWRGLKAEEYVEDGPLFLSVHSLNFGEKVDFRDALNISMERYKESPEIQLQENDILLAKDGAGIGKLGIVKDLDQLATVNSSLLVIKSLEAFVPKFLFYFLSGPSLQNIAKQRITGSATPHLFQRDIKQFVLSIPPIAEQHEIVRRVEALFTIMDKMEARYQIIKEDVEKLTQSILAKAFRGELVSQDPIDEPASILIERIRKEKALEAEIQRTKPTRKVKKMKTKKDKKIEILSVLRKADRNMTPEEVFKAGGFDEESVDVFYDQLRNAVESKHVREVRSGNWIELEVLER